MDDAPDTTGLVWDRFELTVMARPHGAQSWGLALHCPCGDGFGFYLHPESGGAPGGVPLFLERHYGHTRAPRDHREVALSHLAEAEENLSEWLSDSLRGIRDALEGRPYAPGS